MRECIYSHQYGGSKFWHWFCIPHTWKNINKVFIDEQFFPHDVRSKTALPIKIEKMECVDCGRIEINVIVDW